MKNERVYIRTTEKTKLKLLQQSQYYNKKLSDFVLDVAEQACELDVLQLWIHAYVDYTIRRNRVDNGCVITHYKDGEWEYWNVPPLKNGYENRVELLEELRGTIDTVFGYTLPRMWEERDE